MVLLITITVALTVFLVTFLLASLCLPVQGQAAMRLKALDGLVAGQEIGDEELNKPFAQRVLAPLTGSLAGSLVRLTPAAVRRMVGEKLAAAGGFGGLGTDGFLLLCGVLSLSFATLGGFAALVRGAAAAKLLGLIVLGAAVGVALPLLLLARRIADRKASIQKALPDVLDLLTVSIEAGLGFDGALAKLSEKMKGPLVDEFGRALQEMRIGVPRREALHAMGLRCDVADLSLFVSAIVQADQLGVSIGNVLRVQSAAMREKRRQRAQEKAMKAPVKMLIPLVAFIFPAIFVVLVGPAAIRVVALLASR
jgi:tight adherence protein C